MQFRVQKNKENPYVMINKEFLNNPDMTAKAKGILSYILSLPDDWILYEKELIKHFKDGEKSIRSGIKELINLGHISREVARNEKGHYCGYNYSVYEVPTQLPKTECRSSQRRKSNTTNKELKINNKNNKKAIPSFSSTEQITNRNNFKQRQYDEEYLKQFYRNGKS